jgi:large repetitive protein
MGDLVTLITSAPLALGQDTFTAAYLGDDNFAGANSYNSASVTVVQAATTPTITLTPSPAFYDQPVLLQFNVTADAPSVAVPRGLCTLTMDGATDLGCGSLNANGGGSVPFATGLTVGTHTFKFTYMGSSYFLNSTQSTTLVVNKDSPTTSVFSSANPSVAGQAVTLTAIVTPSNPAVVTGSVTFSDGVTVLGTPSVNTNGIASLTTSSLSAGGHTITAAYGGDENFNASSSSLTQTVNSVRAACDINGDGSINIADLQRIVNESLGTIQAADDMNQDGRVTVTDVQIVINAVLGLACTP